MRLIQEADKAKGGIILSKIFQLMNNQTDAQIVQIY